MPEIRPIKDLRNTAEISELCHKTQEPVFITKSGEPLLDAEHVFEKLRKKSGRD